MFKNKLNIILCLSLAPTLAFAADPKPVTAKDPESLYVKVGNLVLESEDHVVKPVTGIGTTAAGKKEEKVGFASLHEKLDATLRPMSSLHKKEVVFNFLAQYGQLKQTSFSIEPYFLNELSIICGSERSKKANLLTHLNKTQTTFGTAVLARMLSEPHADRALIQKRQKMIKLLVENRELFDALDTALKRIKAGEDHFLNFWNPDAQLDPANKSLVWFHNWFNFLNKSPKLFQLERYNSLIAKGSSILSSGAFAIGAPIIGFLWGRQTGNWKSGLLGGCLYGAMFGISAKAIYDLLKLTNKICYASHTRLSSVGKVSQSLQELYDATCQYGEIISGIKSYDRLQEFIVNPEALSTDLPKLQELLQKPIFQSDAKWYSYIGAVITAHTYMDEIKNHFIPVMEAAGELDAYLSIAKVLKEYKKKDVKYCFVDFVQKDTPYIALEAVWNPIIGDDAVTENIMFGKPEEARNVLLTGPHGGGKSTFMKSVAYAILMGQTFGIAPAARATMTMFDRINSYVNIKEDLAAGQSTFMAEKKRVDEISAVLTHLKPEQLSFTIMDEVFKGTMEDEGSRRLYKFGQLIAPIQNSMSMIATHFEKPAVLETETNGDFTNYHVGLIEQADKTFIRTFKLVKGKNEWWFNDKDKRERYIDWLTLIN